MTERNNRFKEKVVLVTGAGAGIGKAISIMFAKEGADLVLNDINKKNAIKVADEIQKIGRKSEVHICNIGHYDSVKKMAEESIKQFGHIDILVNNAGIASRTPAEKLTKEMWNEVLNVNLNGVFYCSKTIGIHMIERRCGNIINISSMAGTAAIPNDLPYVASKHAVIGITRALAIEWARYNIRVNCICPGITMTPLVEKVSIQEPDFFSKRIERIPLGRPATPDDQAKVALFLASEDSCYVTGHVIQVDGGMSALLSGYSVYRETEKKK